MKVLVTAADGFIGSHLTECLLQCGYEVRAFTFTQQTRLLLSQTVSL